jgi:hypothetical protein
VAPRQTSQEDRRGLALGDAENVMPWAPRRTSQEDWCGPALGDVENIALLPPRQTLQEDQRGLALGDAENVTPWPPQADLAGRPAVVRCNRGCFFYLGYAGLVIQMPRKNTEDLEWFGPPKRNILRPLCDCCTA